MFIFHYCKKIDDHLFDEKVPLHQKDQLIQKYSLDPKYKVKEYWLNHVKIISHSHTREFNYIYDKSIEYKDNFLIQEYIMEPCQSFSFYKTDVESEYMLYENQMDSVYIRLQEYDTYLTIEFHCNNKEDFYKNKLLYNNII